MQKDLDIEVIKAVLDDKKSGKTRKGLAEALGIRQPAVSEMLSGKRKLQKNEVEPAANYIGQPLPTQIRGGGPKTSHPPPSPEVFKMAPVRGAAAAGIWLEFEPTIEHSESVPYVPNRYGDLDQFAYLVSGRSMENARIYDGDYVICVDYSIVRATPQAGDIVVVERHRGGLFERACKKIEYINGELRLVGKSDDPRLAAPIEFGTDHEHDQVEIKGLVIGIYRPIK